MNVVQMAALLYEYRDAAQRLLGANFERYMALWAIAIRGVAATDKSTELAAAMKMAREADGFGAIVVFAAFVEMSDPTTTVTNGEAA